MKLFERHIISICCILLAVAVLSASCTNSDGDDVKSAGSQQGQTPTEITVKTNVTAMQSRAATIDDNTDLRGQNLKIDAYYHDTETKYLDGTKLHYDTDHTPSPAWVFWDGSAQLHYYWPFEGSTVAGGSTVASTLDFVGFCPFVKPEYIGTPTYNHSTGVSFTANMSNYMTLARQTGAEAPTIPIMQEFLVSWLPNQTLTTQTTAGGALPMVFKHPFALIKFTITAASGTHVQINSISIPGLNTGGTCTFNGSDMTWGTYTGSAAITIAEVLKNGGTTVGTPFVVIPNNYGTKYLTVNATWDDWSDVTKNLSADVSFDWQPGYIYTYNLTVTKYALKVETEETFTEQW